MKLIDQWRAYTGPRDERVVAEANRIYRTCYVMLTFGMLVIFYYDGLVKQVAAVADYNAGGSGLVVYSQFEVMVFA